MFASEKLTILQSHPECIDRVPSFFCLLKGNLWLFNANISVLTLSNKCSFILTTEGSLVDKIDLPALYISVTRPVQDPLDVKLLDN